MCIAIVTTPGCVVPNPALYKWWLANSDGGGFAYVKNDRVVVDKGHKTYNSFQKAYSEAAKEFAETSPFLVHMRIRTSGTINENNTHPFPVKPQSGPHGAMIHNGVLFHPSGPQAGRGNDMKSDTRVLVETYNNVLRLADVKAAKEDLGRVIGGGNKLAFLYDNKEFVIINEQQGYWHQGIWYSNNWASVLPREPDGNKTKA